MTAGIASNYAGLFDAYSSALTNATAPESRGPATVLLKDMARKTLVPLTRQLARMVSGNISVTDDQLQVLGLTVRKTHRTPSQAPTQEPIIDVTAINGRTLKINLHDGTGSHRAKPAGVAGATVLSFVGSTPPADIASWKFEGSVTRTTTTVSFSPDLLPGATVWITAFWYSPRAMSGPAATPISRTFGASGLGEPPAMKIAA